MNRPLGQPVKCLTFPEIAAEMTARGYPLSPERARQLHDRALQRLYERLLGQSLDRRRPKAAPAYRRNRRLNRRKAQPR